MRRPSKKLWIWLLTLSAVTASAYGLELLWAQEQHEAQVQAAQLLTRDLLPGIAEGKDDPRERLERYVREHPALGYVYFADFRNNRKFTWQDAARLDGLSPGLAAKTQQSAFIRQEVSKTLARPDLEYLHEVSAVYVPDSPDADQTPIGILKAGFILPGKLGHGVRLGQGYRHVLFLWSTLAVTMALFLAFSEIRGAAAPRVGGMTLVADPQKTEEAELTWLEDETGKTEPIFVDEQGRSWKILLDRDTLAGWSVKGNWYVSDAQLCGRPWGASVVRQDFRAPARYHFSFRAAKMAGSDGFVVLFPCGMMNLIWVLGGWGNTRTEVLGYPSSSNALKIRKGEWYFVEVRLADGFVEGFVNGEFNFKIPRAELKHPSPNVTFQKGLGVGVWSTLAKFSDIRLLEL